MIQSSGYSSCIIFANPVTALSLSQPSFRAAAIFALDAMALCAALSNRSFSIPDGSGG